MDFLSAKTYIRLTGMTHVCTAPYYPQSNGKIERFHKTIKGDAIRPGSPGDADEARRIIGGYVRHYNTERLHSAIDYVTPADRLAGRHLAIVAERDRKLEAARERRAECRREARNAERPPASSPEPLDSHPWLRYAAQQRVRFALGQYMIAFAGRPLQLVRGARYRGREVDVASVAEQLQSGTLYVYKLTCDNGGAPCLHRRILSLAICKPRIRVHAQVGDWIIGFGCKTKPDLRGRLIYVAQVTRVERNGDYYALDKYKGRPDRVYRRTEDGFEYIPGSRYHSPGDLVHDLGAAPRFDRASTLLSSRFVYFGSGPGPSLEGIRDIYDDLPRDFTKNHSPEVRRRLEDFVASVLDEFGFGRHGNPTHGDTSAKCYHSEGDELALPGCRQ